MYYPHYPIFLFRYAHYLYPALEKTSSTILQDFEHGLSRKEAPKLKQGK